MGTRFYLLHPDGRKEHLLNEAMIEQVSLSRLSNILTDRVAEATGTTVTGRPLSDPTSSMPYEIQAANNVATGWKMIATINLFSA